MANPIVIDLSHWNADPVWSKVKEGGTIGVIHKATEGTSYVDNTLFKRMSAAKKAGLLTCTYHFLRPGSMDVQMRHYLATIDPVPGERVCLDHEDTGVTLAMLESAVSYIRAVRPDLQITVYSGHLIKEQLQSASSPLLAGNTSLWVAHYTSKKVPTWPKDTWPHWSLWQYTDKADVDGIDGPVDGNKWNGTEQGLVKWLSPTGELPEPEQAPVSVNIQAPAGVEVVVYVNGEKR